MASVQLEVGKDPPQGVVPGATIAIVPLAVGLTLEKSQTWLGPLLPGETVADTLISQVKPICIKLVFCNTGWAEHTDTKEIKIRYSAFFIRFLLKAKQT